MNKIFAFLVAGMVLLMVSGVFVASANSQDDIEDFVKKIVEKKGINKEDIKSVRRVDFDNLPSQVNLKNIDDTNLALYEIDTGGDPIFVLSLSREVFRQTQPDYKRSLLNFGFDGQTSQSKFLETATGVETDLEKGYVMVRGGSITGISTNLEIIDYVNSGQIEIVIYKNAKPIGFSNTINVFSFGVKTDHDIQSEDTIPFESGDVLSVYLKVSGEVSVRDIITMVEITTTE